jgi:serine/threonine protein kinase
MTQATYTTTGILGYGSYGVVFAVRNSKESFALKVLRDTEDQLLPQQTAREIGFLRATQGPGVVPLRGILAASEWKLRKTDVLTAQELGIDGARVGILMDEYQRSICCSLRWSPAQVQQMVSQLLPAVERLSACKIVHRDISRRNILWCPRKGFALADFGNARPRVTMTHSEATDRRWPHPMPPNCFHSATWSERDDLWCLAFVAYTMLTTDLCYGESVRHVERLLHDRFGHDDASWREVPWEDRLPAPGDAVDFLSRALHPVYEKRLSLEEARAHPYVTGVSGSSSKPGSPAGNHHETDCAPSRKARTARTRPRGTAATQARRLASAASPREPASPPVRDVGPRKKSRPTGYSRRPRQDTSSDKIPSYRSSTSASRARLAASSRRRDLGSRTARL